MDEKLPPMHDLILRIVAIGEVLGIEEGLTKLQITECYRILEPVLGEVGAKLPTHKEDILMGGK